MARAGCGVDIDPQRIAEANENARKEGVAHLVNFVLQDAMTVDVSPATRRDAVPALPVEYEAEANPHQHSSNQARASFRTPLGWGLGTRRVEQVEANGFPRTLYLWYADGKVRQ